MFLQFLEVTQITVATQEKKQWVKLDNSMNTIPSKETVCVIKNHTNKGL